MADATFRPPDRPSASPPLLREQPVADPAVPRMDLRDWAERYGVVAGITTPGSGGGFSLRVRREGLVAASEIVMHCGVGICGSCYEVGSEVLERLTPGRRPGVTSGHVDLREVLVRQAAALGVGDISVSPWCSAHDREHFFSHRASGGRGGRMIAYLGVPA